MATTPSVTLGDDERAHLWTFLHRGKANARTLKRAQVLLKLADGWGDAEAAEAFEVCANTVANVRRRWREGGVEAVLHDRPQERRRQALSGAQQAHLIAIACSPVPDGHDHWTLRMLAAQAVELGYVRRLSPETVRQALKKTG
jgi:transposase